MPHSSRPVPGFAVLAVFCSESTADPNLSLRRGRLFARCRRPATSVSPEKLMESLRYWLTFTILKREIIAYCVYHINVKYTIMANGREAATTGCDLAVLERTVRDTSIFPIN
jgi:hypothetical protein